MKPTYKEWQEGLRDKLLFNADWYEDVDERCDQLVTHVKLMCRKLVSQDFRQIEKSKNWLRNGLLPGLCPAMRL